MTFARLYFERFTMAQNIELCLRMVIAFVVGGLIGLERSKRFKEAGVRTHIIVCCTTALIMLISKYGFADMGSSAAMEYYGSKGADTARVAAQAVSGISFLCAGVIIKVGGNIKGLTTAAGIWMTAGIGLAIGAGMYVVSGCTVLLIWLLQYAFYRIPFGVESYDGYHLQFVVKGDEDFESILRKQLKAWNAQITENTINWQRDDKVEFDCTVLRVDEIKYSDVKKFVDENESIVSFSYSPVKTHVQ